MKRVLLLATLALSLYAIATQAKTVWLCNATRARDLLADANIALGNLVGIVGIVAQQIRAYNKTHA